MAPITIPTTCRLEAPFSISFPDSKSHSTIFKPSHRVDRTAPPPGKSSLLVLAWHPYGAPSHMRSQNLSDSTTATLGRIQTLC
jgi:hypothetical protein